MSYSTPDIRISSEELQELYRIKDDLARKIAKEQSDRHWADIYGRVVFETMDGLQCEGHVGEELCELREILRPCKEPIQCGFEAVPAVYRPLRTRKYVFRGDRDNRGRRIYQEAP